MIFHPSQIPDPGVRKAPESRILICNTAFFYPNVGFFKTNFRHVMTSFNTLNTTAQRTCKKYINVFYQNIMTLYEDADTDTAQI